jgi:hypothetical protein
MLSFETSTRTETRRGAAHQLIPPAVQHEPLQQVENLQEQLRDGIFGLVHAHDVLQEGLAKHRRSAKSCFFHSRRVTVVDLRLEKLLKDREHDPIEDGGQSELVAAKELGTGEDPSQISNSTLSDIAGGIHALFCDG